MARKRQQSQNQTNQMKDNPVFQRVMKEFKEGELHSGSKHGPLVVNPRQAVAIALSEARKAGAKIPKPRKK